MAQVAHAELTLRPEPQAVGRARRAVRDALVAGGAAELRDAAELAVSELVTNAVVHARTEVTLRIVVSGPAVRVEIEDGNDHLPLRTTWSKAAATGRGLQIVEAHVDQWDATRTENGKVVWFEIGHPEDQPPAHEPVLDAAPETVQITLLEVPLLAHWAWQEQATTLLREYLLFTLDEDPEALDLHAAASQALTLLREQLPAPRAVEGPGPTPASTADESSAPEVVLRLPFPCVSLFEVVDDLLARALSAARAGELLGAPARPEVITEMCQWLCGEIRRQARGAKPAPWRAAA